MNISHIIDYDCYAYGDDVSEREQTDIAYILKCQRYLAKIRICSSQRQFSKRFLGKSENYLSVVLFEHRKVPADTIQRLVFFLSKHRDSIELMPGMDGETKVINGLIQQGQSLLMTMYLGKQYEQGAMQ